MRFINLSTLIAIALAVFHLQSPQAPQVADKNAPSKITIVSKDEPGERLIVSGRVFGPDGKSPLAGVSIYVYQTDAKGLYTPETNDNRNPRLRGYLRTDEQGRYEFSTIKPAAYPGQSPPPAHIHYVVNAQNHSQKVFEIVFEGDPLISRRIRENAARQGSPFSIRPLSRDQQKVWRCTQDIIMQR